MRGLGRQLKGFLLFGGWLVPLAAIWLITDSEAYKEWKDPVSYWSGKVASSEVSLRDTQNVIADCTQQLSALQAENAQQIWVAAKRLEEKSPREAADDYVIETRSLRYACEAMKLMLGSIQRTLANERGKLQQASR